MLERFRITEPVRIGFKVIAAITVSELAIILVLRLLNAEKWMSPVMIVLTDTLALGIIASLIIFYWVVNPMKLIEKKRKEEEKLRETNEILQALIKASPVAIMTLDTNRNVITWNPAAERIFGWNAKEVFGKPPPFIPEDKQEEFLSLYNKAVKGEVLRDIELKRQRIDGALLDIRLSTSPLHDSRGNITGVMAIITDITEMKKAEESGKESEEKFRKLSEESLIGIYIIQDGIFKYVNPKMAEIFGYEVKELIEKKGPEDLTLPEDWPAEEESLRKRVSGEIESVSYTFRGITKNKEIIYVEAYGSRTMYQGLPAIIGTLQDITERKNAEERRNYLLEEIIRAKRDWEMTFDSALEFIILVDKELNIVRCNRSFAESVGKPIEEIIGNKFYDRFHLNMDEIDYYRDRIEAEEPSEPIEIKTETGQWFYLSQRPIMDKDGIFQNSVIIATDITAMKDAYQRLIESEEELKKRLSDLERFYEMAVGREIKMKELKKEVETLKARLSLYEREGRGGR